MARISVGSAVALGKSSQDGGEWEGGQLPAAPVLWGNWGAGVPPLPMGWHHGLGWGSRVREHVSVATLADAGFKTITCGTSGSGCFFIANILLIVLCCAVILIKQDLESRRLKRVNQGHGTASAICIAISHGSPALGKDEGPHREDPRVGSSLHPELLGRRGFVGAAPWGGSPNSSPVLEDLCPRALPGSKVSPDSFLLLGLPPRCFFLLGCHGNAARIHPWSCPHPSLVLQVSATSLLPQGTTEGGFGGFAWPTAPVSPKTG